MKPKPIKTVCGYAAEKYGRILIGAIHYTKQGMAKFLEENPYLQGYSIRKVRISVVKEKNK